MIHELNYFNINYQEELVGGVIVTLEGKRNGRVDRDLKGSQFKGCNLNNDELVDCETEGMRINNILVKDLLEAYKVVRRDQINY